ncbi:MAG: OmpA family protein [Flavobacterium nitrogenifigens]|uniref:OmpA family protein n=1 Tax=Flavobacterium nitrogenifigens TaxID=1617283 RepID=UPI00280A2717|nr:OmpA family protein [Flavobacterium nitrogenifigens]MDQ8015298.1 OmpA family protein [Flavobacterium nitrogenifigens]
MMIYKKLKIAFIFLLICTLSIGAIYAQDNKLAKANEAYNKFAFIEAIKLYEAQIAKGVDTVELYTKLGDCYYYNGNYAEAVKCYSRILSFKGDLINPEYFFRYAQALNSVQKYSEAEAVMKKYYSKSGKTDLSKNWNEEKLLNEIQKQSGRYSLKGVELNTPFSDFGTAFYGTDKVLYATAKDTGVIIKRKHSWNEKSFLKLYSADITIDGDLKNPNVLKGEVNTRYHQSTPVITKDGKTMFFTRNNYEDGKLAADKNGTSYLKIFSAQNVDGVWKNVKALSFPVNSNGFSSAHPALSPDEKELYFVSDRDNSFGNSDIYVVSVNKGFVGNDVKKLSDEINTLGRETYPFVDDSGILYFSSDGHPGLGGLDVFAAAKDNNGVYHVVNLGDGVNTKDDDFAYIIKNDTKKGYFSSNRSGNDDIYSFTENREPIFDFDVNPLVYGTLKFVGGKPIKDMAIEVYNEKNDLINTVYSDAEGNYQAILKPFVDYRLVYKKTGLTEKIQLVPPLKPAEKREYSFEFINELEVIVDNEIKTINDGDDLNKILNLKPIYFDYNGYKIRESSKAELNKIVEVMSTRPVLSLTVNSHTDSRGRDDFNMKLSENRAKATVDYLVAHGISADRIKGFGYGETRLVNRCSNGVTCSEQEHQENRRSEFIITVN